MSYLHYSHSCAQRCASGQSLALQNHHTPLSQKPAPNDVEALRGSCHKTNPHGGRRRLGDAAQDVSEVRIPRASNPAHVCQHPKMLVHVLTCISVADEQWLQQELWYWLLLEDLLLLLENLLLLLEDLLLLLEDLLLLLEDLVLLEWLLLYLHEWLLFRLQEWLFHLHKWLLLCLQEWLLYLHE